MAGPDARRRPSPEPPEPPAADTGPGPLDAERATSRPDRVRAWTRAGGLIAALLLISVFAVGEAPPEGGHLGIWSLLPALTTLVLVFLTREVISSLFLGIVVGGLVSGRFNLIDAFLIPSIGSPAYAMILLVYLWALGGLIGLWTRTGGARAFAVWAGEGIVSGPRSARFFAWLMGVVFHQGGTISTILAGTTVRPVTDQHRVSHEELTYLVDSTASPAATVLPFNAWPLYVGGLVAGTIPLLPDETAAVEFFFRSLPFNFYGMFAIVSTLLFALGWLPWVPPKMARAQRRARETGQLNAPTAQPIAAAELTELRIPKRYRGGIADFLLPMGTLLGVAIVPFLFTGEVAIAEAFGLAVLVAFALALAKGMELKEAMDGFVDGCKGVTVGALILGLAVTLGEVSKALGTAAFIVEATAGIIHPTFLPALLMGICMAVAFSIGSSWGTYAVVFPIALPLAFALNPDPFYLSVCFGAVLGGAVFGDQCSPISDTTILSALACGADLMDHVTTQIPLALAAAGLAAVASTLAVLLGMILRQEVLEQFARTVEPLPGFDRVLFRIAGTDVTLASVISFVVFLLLAFLISAVLQRVMKRVYVRREIGEGVQYALNRLLHYAVVGIGIFLALDNLGISITALAGLGAILAVGIGFGLQNIAQNFVSGLILLLERPVKQGDFVEVGTSKGTVREIRARATVVTTVDNVDILVPNGQFITEPVVNQTFSNRRIRIRVEVGVAYGSDTDLVRRTLERVATQHELVLKEPPPKVWFTSFGESSLDFSVLVWIEEPILQPQISSDLRFAIDRAFRAAGIEIPFPQRDLHLRTSNVEL